MEKTKARPIILNTDEVRANLLGQKTQHRVPFDFDFIRNMAGIEKIAKEEGITVSKLVTDCYNSGDYYDFMCPFGKAGDRLWVKERFIADPPADDDAWEDEDSLANYFMWDGCGRKLSEIPRRLRKPEYIIYKADHRDPDNYLWCIPSRMPKWASRILLEITDIRIERLQDISADDAINEGCPLYGPFGEYRGSNRNRPNDPMKYKAYGTPQDAFACIWMSKHGRESWVSNPWVWAIKFKKVEV